MNKNFVDKSKFLRSTLGSTSMTKAGSNTINSPKVDKTRDGMHIDSQIVKK